MKSSPFFSGFTAGAAIALLSGVVYLNYVRPPAKPVPVQPPAVSTPVPAPVMTGYSSPAKGPDNAPVAMIDFSDFQCPFCKKVYPQTKKLMEKYSGKARLIFKHFPLAETPNQGSFLVHQGSVCAQEQGKFWEFYSGVYESEAKLDETGVSGLAAQIGLDADTFSSCLKSDRAVKAVQADIAEGKAAGIQGTPTFLINGERLAGAYPYEKFEEIVEGALDPAKKRALQQQAAPQAPAVPVVFDDLKGRPAAGAENAKVTLVEFSDFHCPFCRQLSENLKKVMENKVNEGKVRLVWRHYPLRMHPGAEKTHRASECAHEQGKFWELQEKIFTGGLRDEASVRKAAAEMKIDEKKFDACMAAPASEDAVKKDMAKGAASGVRGTPALFVNGRLYPGALPAEKIQQLIDAELAKG